MRSSAHNLNTPHLLHNIKILLYYKSIACGYRIMVIMTVFQTVEAGSIPATRSKR